MNDPDDPRILRRRADWAFASLLGVGLAVWALVTILTGDLALGLVYGLLPGVALGTLGRVRILRGGIFKPTNRPDTGDRGRA